ncbi:putative small secreted protein [Paucimonas lemoignei]|uniref:Putative small secreted protein n=1 Tax=Paucimonas lemoignei TaxID=29443 RepID=A0A4R3HQH5_PAULE|nr:entericidin A/B family lipoprotein [Paucimonas lemoignei]TCS34707.1 putative small secreted protein [Paucimonas lemoignei]
MAKRLLLILSVLTFTAGMTACNTMKGFGQDVERGGEKIQRGSDDARK